LPGLSHEVRICRDEVGIPHIFAENLADLGFGVGVAMAQDRRWQMEAMRRLADGRMAEQRATDGSKGGPSRSPSLLAVDRFYRSAPPVAKRNGRTSATRGAICRRVCAWVNAWETVSCATFRRSFCWPARAGAVAS
jgi:hypothetical protein